MSGVLPTVNVTDVPENRAKVIKGFAITGRAEVKEIANGFVQVRVPLHFFPPETPGVDLNALTTLTDTVLAAYDNGTVEQTLESTGLRTFTARFNVRPEWFQTSYAQLVQNGSVDENEKIQYNINMSGLTRGLFRAIGSEAIDFDRVGGQVVGFSTRTNKKEPSRLDISAFYQAR